MPITGYFFFTYFHIYHFSNYKGLQGPYFPINGIPGKLDTAFSVGKKQQKALFRDGLHFAGGESNLQMLNSAKLPFLRHPVFSLSMNFLSWICLYSLLPFKNQNPVYERGLTSKCDAKLTEGDIWTNEVKRRRGERFAKCQRPKMMWVRVRI